jgi:hypothetical protein
MNKAICKHCRKSIVGILGEWIHNDAWRQQIHHDDLWHCLDNPENIATSADGAALITEEQPA